MQRVLGRNCLFKLEADWYVNMRVNYRLVYMSVVTYVRYCEENEWMNTPLNS